MLELFAWTLLCLSRRNAARSKKTCGNNDVTETHSILESVTHSILESAADH